MDKIEEETYAGMTHSEMKNLFCKLGYQWEMDDDGFWFEEYLSDVKVKEMLDHVNSYAKQEREAVRAEMVKEIINWVMSNKYDATMSCADHVELDEILPYLKSLKGDE